MRYLFVYRMCPERQCDVLFVLEKVERVQVFMLKTYRASPPHVGVSFRSYGLCSFPLGRWLFIGISDYADMEETPRRKRKITTDDSTWGWYWISDISFSFFETGLFY